MTEEQHELIKKLALIISSDYSTCGATDMIATVQEIDRRLKALDNLIVAGSNFNHFYNRIVKEING